MIAQKKRIRKPLEKRVEPPIFPPNLARLQIAQAAPTQPIDMADLQNRYEDNVKGDFYVDDQCIDCDLCRETAPDNFTRNDDGGYSFVYKQPESDDEIALAEEAMEGCPVEAIGRDGADA